MLTITKFNAIDDWDSVKFDKVNPFTRQCVVYRLIVNDNGKMKQLATITIGYPKQHRTGFETYYALLEVYYNHSVFWGFSSASGCGYCKKSSAMNSAFNKMFDTNNASGGDFSEQTLFEAIAKFFGYDNFLIV